MLLWIMNLGFAGGIGVQPPDVEGLEFTMPVNRHQNTQGENRLHFTELINRLHFTMKEEDD